MRGGIFRFVCAAACGQLQWEKMAWENDHVTCPTCLAPARRVAATESGKHAGMDYDQPVLSDSMGVNAEQVAEHRQKFPDVPILDDGRVVLRNHYEAKRIRKRLGFFDRAGYC